MRNTTRNAALVSCFVLALAVSALCQNRLQSEPVSPVAGPAYDLSVGYSNLTMAVPSAGHLNLNGPDFSGSVALNSRWGVTVDSSYLRASDVFDTHHQSYVLTAQSGPVFYLMDHRNTRLFLHGLAGMGLVDGAVPSTDNKFFHGWLVRPAYTVGAGLEHSLTGGLGVRVSGDYLRTSFYDAAGAEQAQNNLRLTVSLVFRVRQHRPRPGF